MATNTKSTVGEEIDSRCLKCKDITSHIIIAMLKEKIAKVQCNVCGGRHNYRPAQEIKTKKTSSTKKSAAKTKISMAKKKTAENFAKLMNGRELEKAIPYTMTSTFGKNDLVNHPMFGLGLVTATIQPNKIELTFEEGPKIFICQLRKPAPPVPRSGIKTKRKKRV